MPYATTLMQRLRPSQLAWLMGLYGENYRLIQRLLPSASMAEGRYLSSVDDGLDLHLDVLAHHPYTLELRLSYSLTDPITGLPDPSAYLRLYHDSRQAEATHCYVGRRWQDVLGLRPTRRALLEHRLRMNSFLAKWLEYLDGLGHHCGSVRYLGPLPAPKPVAQSIGA